MSLPKATIREFRKALDGAQPLWVKLYVCCVGLPAWAYLAYRASADNDPLRGLLGQVAVAAFASAVVLQLSAILRAFWRNDL